MSSCCMEYIYIKKGFVCNIWHIFITKNFAIICYLSGLKFNWALCILLAKSGNTKFRAPSTVVGQAHCWGYRGLFLEVGIGQICRTSNNCLITSFSFADRCLLSSSVENFFQLLGLYVWVIRHIWEKLCKFFHIRGVG